MKQLLIAMLWLISTVVQAEVSLQIDAATVPMGQTFHVVISKESAGSMGLPDITPLQKDFTIVGTERSMNYSVVNGQASTVSQWVIALTPKHTGILTIPPLHFGADLTTAMSIEVTSESSNSNSNTSQVTTPPNDVMLVAEVSNEAPYINQQTLYTVKLYNSRRLLDAAFQGPVVNDALLIPLGSTRQYQATENDQLYTVEEQRYAIFPQKSGEMTITPPSFSALIYESIPKQINVKGQPVTVQVKPAASSFKNKTWLPAKNVSLVEKYDSSTDDLHEGSTLVRTVTLAAIGLPGQLLPPLTFEKNKGFSSYAEKPIEKNNLRDDDLIGSTTVKVTYLLNQSGSVIIPALHVAWFNTATEKEEIASLPELTMTIFPNTSLPAPLKTNEISQQSELVDLKTTKLSPKLQSTNSISWWLAGGFALAWVLTLLFMWQRKRPLPLAKRQQKALKIVKEACLANQTKQAKEALIQWAKLQWPNHSVLNLSEIIELIDDVPIKKQILGLMKALYKNNESAWRGEALWRYISSYQKTATVEKKTINDFLPPINPL